MSDHAWGTPARRKLYGRPTVNGITCQICGCDMCQCNRLVPVSDPPRAATIGEHVDAVLAAKDAEIERLRAENARLQADAATFHEDYRQRCDVETKALHVEIERLIRDLASATRERDVLAAFIERKGYRRCDTAACNCGSWHGGHASDRLEEAQALLKDCRPWVERGLSDHPAPMPEDYEVLARLDAFLVPKVKP